MARVNTEQLGAELSEVRQTLEKLTSALSVTHSYTFYEWLDEWLKFKAQKLAKKSISDLRGVCNHYLRAQIPDKPLAEVTAPELQATMTGAPKFVQETIFRVVHGAFSRAFALGYIRADISVNVKRVTVKRYTGRALTTEEVRTLFTVCDRHRVGHLLRFVLYTGCRAGEALAVRWSDIDFIAETIRIPGTKSATSDRTIPFFGEIRSILEKIPRDGDRVFPYTRQVFNDQMPLVRRDCGFYFRIHDLRHTFATHCMECGISLATLSKWLGHTSVAVTCAVYLHMGKQWQDEETRKFRNYTE